MGGCSNSAEKEEGRREIEIRNWNWIEKGNFSASALASVRTVGERKGGIWERRNLGRKGRDSSVPISLRDYF